MELAKIPSNELCAACPIIREMADGAPSATWIKGVIKRLENGFPKGESITIGCLPSEVVKFCDKKNIILKSHNIRISDTKIKHALRDIKKDKGKAISNTTLVNIAYNIKTCNIYYDTVHNNFVFTNREGNKLFKYVIQPNYTIKINRIKTTENHFITAGLILDSNIDDKYIKIR